LALYVFYIIEQSLGGAPRKCLVNFFVSFKESNKPPIKTNQSSNIVEKNWSFPSIISFGAFLILADLQELKEKAEKNTTTS
jgi:hypothetical protein